jgi:hypothetical protein
MEGVGEAQFRGGFFHHKPAIEEQLRGSLHFEPRQKLIWAEPSETLEQPAQVSRIDVACASGLFEVSQAGAALLDQLPRTAIGGESTGLRFTRSEASLGDFQQKQGHEPGANRFGLRSFPRAVPLQKLKKFRDLFRRGNLHGAASAQRALGEQLLRFTSRKIHIVF